MDYSIYIALYFGSCRTRLGQAHCGRFFFFRQAPRRSSACPPKSPPIFVRADERLQKLRRSVRSDEHTEAKRFFPVGGTSQLSLDHYGVFFSLRALTFERALLLLLFYAPWGKQIRRPHFDAAQTSELRLCEKHFWRDIGRSYFGARANWVGHLYHRSSPHDVERIKVADCVGWRVDRSRAEMGEKAERYTTKPLLLNRSLVRIATVNSIHRGASNR